MGIPGTCVMFPNTLDDSALSHHGVQICCREGLLCSAGGRPPAQWCNLLLLCPSVSGQRLVDASPRTGPTEHGWAADKHMGMHSHTNDCGFKIVPAMTIRVLSVLCVTLQWLCVFLTVCACVRVCWRVIRKLCVGDVPPHGPVTTVQGFLWVEVSELIYAPPLPTT